MGTAQHSAAQHSTALQGKVSTTAQHSMIRPHDMAQHGMHTVPSTISALRWSTSPCVNWLSMGICVQAEQEVRA